jgi:hypothetical protein
LVLGGLQQASQMIFKRSRLTMFLASELGGHDHQLAQANLTSPTEELKRLFPK